MTKKKTGIGSHQTTEGTTDEWMTPPWIIKALGEFDLDPCCPIVRPWDTAKKHYSVNENGLLQPWEGRVWLNPPYNRYTIAEWLKPMANHDNGILLLFNRSETEAFHDHIYPNALTEFVPKGRFTFHLPTGEKAPHNGGAPSVFFSFGEQNADALADLKIPGIHKPINMATAILIQVSPSWKNVVYIAITKLNGQAQVKDIYDIVERIAPDKVSKNPAWKEKVRQKLQLCFTKIKRGHYVCE